MGVWPIVGGSRPFSRFRLWVWSRRELLPSSREVRYSMPFALLQSRLEIPDVDALKRAFKGVGDMAPSDAPHVAADAFGILLKQLTLENALALQASLGREGIATEVVDHAELGELPEAKRVRRIAARDEGLVVCDPLDRELVLPWESFRIVSCGLVLETEIRRNPAPSGALSAMTDWEPNLSDLVNGRFGVGSMGTGSGSALVSSSERQSWKWTADLILSGGSMRFVFSPDRLFHLDRERQNPRNAEVDFLELVRAVGSRSTRAVLNRVAYALREGEAETLSYPSRNAYQEELIWLVWRLRHAGRLG